MTLPTLKGGVWTRLRINNRAVECEPEVRRGRTPQHESRISKQRLLRRVVKFFPFMVKFSPFHLYTTARTERLEDPRHPT
jgi:hypothetical protein